MYTYQCYRCKKYLSLTMRSDHPEDWWHSINLNRDACGSAIVYMVPVCNSCDPMPVIDTLSKNEDQNYTVR